MINFNVFYGQFREEININKRPSVELIRAIIEKHAPERERLQGLYARYAALEKGVPIDNREKVAEGRANNKTINNFFHKIVDTKVSYGFTSTSFGLYPSPTRYGDQENDENKAKYLRDNEILQDFITINSMQRSGMATAKFAGICGFGVKHLYIDKNDAKLKVMDGYPYEYIFLSDTDVPRYCLRYFDSVQIDKNGHETTETDVEFYTDNTIEIYKIKSGDVKFIETKPNGIGKLPIIRYNNNAELNPDCSRAVLTLIDAYDRIISDGVDDLDEFTEAFLAFFGFGIPQDTAEQRKFLDDLRASRTLFFDDVRGGAKGAWAEWLTKNLNPSYLQYIANTLEANIYAFADSINTNDVNFANNVSGIAMEYKTIALETAVKMTECEFKAADMQLFEVACAYWKKLYNVDISYWDIYSEYKRNRPKNFLYEAEIVNALKNTGLLSDETLISQFSFIDDVQEEIRKRNAELENALTPSLTAYEPETPPVAENE